MVITSSERERIDRWTSHSISLAYPWSRQETESQFVRGRRFEWDVVCKSFLLRRRSRRISDDYAERWSMGGIRVSCGDPTMVSVRRLRPTCPTSNAWVHEVVSNVYEYRGTRTEGNEHVRRPWSMLTPMFRRWVVQDIDIDLEGRFRFRVDHLRLAFVFDGCGCLSSNVKWKLPTNRRARD